MNRNGLRSDPWMQILEPYNTSHYFDLPNTTNRTYSETHSKNNKEQSENLFKDLIIEIEESKSANVIVRTYKRKNKWRLLRSVIIAVALFRRKEVEIIENTEQLEEALDSYRPQGLTLPHPKSPQQTIFDDIRKEHQFYKLISRGAPEDIQELQELIKHDKNVLNKPNKIGLTPLYIASQNGNLGMVKYLLENKVDLGKKSKVSEREEESNLVVAARWNHESVVNFYLDEFEWTLKDLREAYIVARTNKIRQRLANLIGKHKKCCFFILR